MRQTRMTNEQYGEMVKQASPNSHLWTDCLKAFLVGGAICLLGEAIMKGYAHMGLDKEQSGMMMSVTLIFAAALLTGLGLYEKLGKIAGAGSVVPITGFANSVAAPAIEFKKEGFIFGVGAKMFVVAGPVIVYGTLTSVIIGIIHYLTQLAK